MWGELAKMAIGPLVGGAVSAFGQNSANETNRQLAREQMAFQENMSNTAYQRSMADMEKAGLNPMLAFMKGGASTPGGATAKMENVAEGAERVPMEVMALKSMKAATAKTEAETELLRDARGKQRTESEIWETIGGEVLPILKSLTGKNIENTAKGFGQSIYNNSLPGRLHKMLETAPTEVKNWWNKFKSQWQKKPAKADRYNKHSKSYGGSY